MALDLWNELNVEPASRLNIGIEGEGAEVLPRDESNVIYQAMAQFCRDKGREVPMVSLQCRNRIPLFRGLGSSSAAIVSGLFAANQLLGKPATKLEILQMAAAMEGHADNVAPAIFGGCRIIFKEGDSFLHREVVLKPPAPQAVLFIPELEIPTSKARAVLPASVPRADAIFNASRTALLVNALTAHRYEDLKWAFQDKLHQTYRQAIYPAMPRIFEAALSAGARGVFLSGSGSTILALCSAHAAAVGRAMLNAGAAEGLKAGIVVTKPVERGAEVRALSRES